MRPQRCGPFPQGAGQDIAALYDILKGAKNPADLLMVSIRWMEQGRFKVKSMRPRGCVAKASGRCESRCLSRLFDSKSQSGEGQSRSPKPRTLPVARSQRSTS